MAENTELTTTDQVSAQELAEVIEELEKYRERLLNETVTTAQRAKVSKSKALAQIEPLLTEIDTRLQALRNQQVAVNTSN